MYTLDNDYNHLIVTKPWNGFRRGQLIWANHGQKHRTKPFYYHSVPGEGLVDQSGRIPQECAINVHDSIWVYGNIKYRILSYQARSWGGLRGRSYVCVYDGAKRSKEYWGGPDLTCFINLVRDKKAFWLDGSGEK